MAFKFKCPSCDTIFHGSELAKYGRLVEVSSGLTFSNIGTERKYLITCNTCEVSFYIPIPYGEVMHEKGLKI